MGTIIPYRGGARSRTPTANWHSDRMRARSALFDVYGDHLRSRGDQAPVSALIRLLEPVGIAAPAVRTAISRMSAQGWLEPTRVDAAPGYRATRRAIERLSEAASRIYRSRAGAVGRPLAAGLRRRAPRARRRGHGCGRSSTTWGTPSTRRACGCARSSGPRSTRSSPGPVARARHAVAVDLAPDPVEAWDLARLSTSYAAWPDLADALVRARPTAAGDEDEAAFAARFRLVHEWRKFLFDDPGLPAALLPRDWPGQAAADLFTSEAAQAQAGLRPVRGPLPGRVTAAVNSLRA